jgi:hypothetical protein
MNTITLNLIHKKQHYGMAQIQWRGHTDSYQRGC